MYKPYVYRWLNTLTGMYYIGSHTAKNSFPGDCYICSSKIVKPLIQANPSQWIKSFLYIGNTKDEVIAKEAEFLKRYNAKADPLSYNQHNGDADFVVKYVSEEARAKMSAARKGKAPWNKGIPRTQEVKDKIRKALQGRSPPNKNKPMPEHQRQAMIGQKYSEERKANISASLKGRIPWNKGLKINKEYK